MARLKLDHRQLEQNQVTDHCFVETAQFAQRKGDVVKDRKRRKECALLKEHSKAAAERSALLVIAIEKRLAEEFKRPRARPQQADDLAQQRRLATARATDQAQHLPRFDVEIDILMNHHIAEARTQAADFDGRHRSSPPLRQGDLHSGRPTLRVRMAATASTRIATVIAVTTEAVVCDDRLSVFGLTLRPK